MSDSMLETVQDIYEAFGGGDVPAILDAMTDDVAFCVGSSSGAPWCGFRHGQREVPKFSESLGAACAGVELSPLAFASRDTAVMVVIACAVTVRATCKNGDMDLHHWWRFRDGKAYYVRGTEDTALTA